MQHDTDIFRIETNHVVPTRGKVLISEPFLCDYMFGRSVVLLIDHTKDSTMGLILNKPSPLCLGDLFKEVIYKKEIPIYLGGPLSNDTLFYLHTLKGVEGAMPIRKGFYVNGDFNAIRQYIMEGNEIRGKIRFFLGYAGWDHQQLNQEIKENTWLVSTENTHSLMNEEESQDLWKNSLGKLGGKYEMWSRFPQIPSLN